jgi:hypothetical protein
MGLQACHGNTWIMHSLLDKAENNIGPILVNMIRIKNLLV